MDKSQLKEQSVGQNSMKVKEKSDRNKNEAVTLPNSP